MYVPVPPFPEEALVLVQQTSWEREWESEHPRLMSMPGELNAGSDNVGGDVGAVVGSDGECNRSGGKIFVKTASV